MMIAPMGIALCKRIQMGTHYSRLVLIYFTRYNMRYIPRAFVQINKRHIYVQMAEIIRDL